MEKSFSDLFKRFEKQKEVIEGYQKNEDSLKKCVEDYIVKIGKEGQRYQALKAHAEENSRWQMKRSPKCEARPKQRHWLSRQA